MPVKAINIVVDQRFQKSPDGCVWSHTPPTFDFFESALAVFGEVRIIARTSEVAVRPVNAKLVNGPRVKVIPVPSYVGPLQYLGRRTEIATALAKIARLDGAFLLRIPSQTAFLLAQLLEAQGRTYAVELLTDPRDFFAPGVSPNGLAYLFRPYFCSRSRELCSRAIAANYITGAATRAANPALAAKWVGSVSDVDLPTESFITAGPAQLAGPLKIVTVGLLDLLYKGQDLLSRSLARCWNAGLDFRLSIVGDGRSRERLLNLARSQGVADRVIITGALGGSTEVRTYLERAHLFVLPSRAEGIPRALLEAMAARLPAICSNVGAMPDLLDPKWIIPVNSELALSGKLMEFARDREQWEAIGLRNQRIARAFERNQLWPQRIAFFESIRNFSLEAAPLLPRSAEVFHAA